MKNTKGRADDLALVLKEVTEELKKANDLQENLLRRSIDGVIVWEKDGTIVVFSRGAEDLLGYKADDVIGQMNIERIYDPDVAEGIKESLKGPSSIEGDQFLNAEMYLTAKNREKIPVRTSGAILFDNGEATGAFCFYRDLRRIKGLEETLEGKVQDAAVGRQVAEMSHYMKNILNKLEGGAYMVNTSLKKSNPEILARGWRIVESNINKISDLVMNLILLSKYQEPEPDWCSPNDIAQDVFDLMTERAEDYHLSLVKDLAPDMKECYIDLKMAHRALLNVGAFAIEVCRLEPERGKACTLVLKTAKKKKGLRFDVVLKGPNLAKKFEGKAFEEVSLAHSAQGEGLGLLVSKDIAEDNDGTITLKTSPDKDVTFSIYLPDQPSE